MTEYQIDAWKKGVYNALAAIADLEAQKLEWTGSTSLGSKMISRVFDLEFQMLISYLIDNEEGTSLILSKMIKIDRILDDYSKVKLSDDKMLLDPEWHAITQKAAEIVALWDTDMEEE
jgi:hypothetical protein